MKNAEEIKDIEYDKTDTDGKPFVCPHCKKHYSYENIVAQETAEKIENEDMIYLDKECKKIFRMMH